MTKPIYDPPELNTGLRGLKAQIDSMSDRELCATIEVKARETPNDTLSILAFALSVRHRRREGLD